MSIFYNLIYVIMLMLLDCIDSFGQTFLRLDYNCEKKFSAFTKVHVIDNRAEHQLLGYLQTGFIHHSEQVFFKGELADSLAEFFPTTTGADIDENPLVFVLNEFFMNEDTYEFIQTGKLKISLRLFRKSGENRFKEIMTVDSLFTVKAKDVTKKLLHEVSEQFCRISRTIPTITTDELREGPEYSIEQLYYLDSLETLKIPIYITERLSSGIYKDYAHFSTNTPDVPCEIQIRQSRSRKKLKVYRLYGDRKRRVSLPTEGTYAVSDGRLLAKATSGGFFEIKKINRDLYYDRPGSFSDINPVNYSAAPLPTGSIMVFSTPREKPHLYRFKINHRRGNSIPVAIVK